MRYPAQLIPVAGYIRDVDVSRFEDLSPLIGGGCGEVVRVSRGRLIIDDEGVLKGLPVNPRASVLYAGGPLLPTWPAAVSVEHRRDLAQVLASLTEGAVLPLAKDLVLQLLEVMGRRIYGDALLFAEHAFLAFDASLAP